MSHSLYYKINMFNLKFRDCYRNIFSCLSFKTVKLLSELLIFRIQSPLLQSLTLIAYSCPSDLAFGCTKVCVFQENPS